MSCFHSNEATASVNILGITRVRLYVMCSLCYGDGGETDDSGDGGIGDGGVGDGGDGGVGDGGVGDGVGDIGDGVGGEAGVGEGGTYFGVILSVVQD